MSRLLGLMLTGGLLLPTLSGATALKVCNDTPYNWRVSVDGATWEYIEAPTAYVQSLQSGDCASFYSFAEHVAARWYHVVLEYQGGDGGWAPGFDDYMWGGYYTNVAQLGWAQGPWLRYWWEFGRGGRCRDKPPLPGVRSASCLVSHEQVEEWSREHENVRPQHEPGGANR